MSATLNALLALAADYQPVTASLSPDTLAVLFYFEVAMQQKRTWLQWFNPFDDITDSEWDQIDEMVSVAFRELMTPMIGQIVEIVTATYPPNILPCDGATYNRVDYPDLYAALDSAFIIDADTFQVPDLRDRVTVGESGTRATGDTGGEETHTLTIDESAPHDHSATDAGHVHSEVAAIPSIINGGLEAPAVAAEATPASTGVGFANITIGSTGGGQPHNNMQPFLVLKKGIIAQ